MNRRQFLGAAAAFAIQRRLDFRKLDLSVANVPAVPVLQPYVQNVRSDRAVVMWATQSPGIGYVQYSADGVNYKSAPASARTFQPSETLLPSPITQFKAILPRLAANTTYLYNPYVNSSAIGPGSAFTTAPAAGSGTFRFLAMGDSGMGAGAADGGAGQLRIANQLASEQAAFLIHAGDIAYMDGSFAQFQQNYFNYYQNIMARIPFFTAPGNHEYASPNAMPYISLHCVPTETVVNSDWGRYYSFDWGNAHFVSIDSNDGPLGGTLDAAIRGNCDMLDWLDRDLRSTRQFWRIVFFHHPPYAGGANFGDPNEPATRTYLVPILEAHGVQLVLNGHEHNYQRTYSVKGGTIVPDGTGTVYLTVGGAGASLYDCFQLGQTAFQKKTFNYARIDVSGSLLTVSAIDDYGFQFDKAVIAPQPTLAGPSSAVTFDGTPTAGSLIHFHGWNLATQETLAQTVSNGLAGTSLTINGTAVALIYVSPTQIVGQLPFDMPPTSTYRISTPNGSTNGSIAL